MKYVVMANGENKIVEALDLTDLLCFQLTQEEQDNLLGILVYKEN